MSEGLPLVTLPGVLLQAKRSRKGGRALSRGWSRADPAHISPRQRNAVVWGKKNHFLLSIALGLVANGPLLNAL